MTTDQEYRRLRFSAPVTLRGDFLGVVMRYAPQDAALRVLDVGCGSGELVRTLAEQLPEAEFVGVDVSAENISAARAATDAEGLGKRVRFECADYRAFEAGRFELVFSYGVLHLVPGDALSLSRKLARDLAPGGVFVNCMPYRSLHNQVLVSIRRLCRRLRGPAMDALLLAAARIVHGRSLSEDQLAERRLYMYVVPERYTNDLESSMTAAGLVRVAPPTPERRSFAKLRHHTTVYRKD